MQASFPSLELLALRCLNPQKPRPQQPCNLAPSRSAVHYLPIKASASPATRSTRPTAALPRAARPLRPEGQRCGCGTPAAWPPQTSRPPAPARLIAWLVATSPCA
eukprot:1310147-Pleurochrysis_carterae.AAC.2